jgi:2-methylaconitate cis-trans-isomerase PrpF
MKAIPVSIYRGGTSRALFFKSKDLPRDRQAQDEVILKAMGSGHALQIDGLGGGNPLTSKCAVIGPPSVPGADVDYTFVYPSITDLKADRQGNCGNISLAVGPFSVNEGLVSANGDRASVWIYNTNTESILKASFAVKDGCFAPEGDFAIDGVPGTGSKITLAFEANPKKALLPTGKVCETMDVEGFSEPLTVSIVQAGNLVIFCSMAALGINGAPCTWQGDDDLWRRMEAVRGAGAVRLGMANSAQEAKQTTPAVPKIVAVALPDTYTDLQGRLQNKGEHDLKVLMAAMGVMHRSFAITASVATAAAAVLPGSIVNQMRHGEGQQVVLAHPSGKRSVEAELVNEDGVWRAKTLALSSTAKQILKGTVFIKEGL